ncbi:hypothetical protein GN244_ATG15942 [Phytophthora infestans]|uniref:Bzip transcription factor n=1 Tax=Phytophthora infestans TaxID=4787 RepID=A0A833SLN0_PHYIN|nr:hypothetical protein GN244_ATG15942 [Phytophthora infestans]KAF4127831.1 hypothetical protein GN958_ATG23062 [Phytophthora infestans]
MPIDEEQQSYSNEPDWGSVERCDRGSADPRPLTMQEICAITDQDTLRELHSLMKDRRDRRAIIQQRHIKIKQKMVESLVESIPKLQNEVERLQMQRLKMREMAPRENFWFVALEYFRVFQHGFPDLDISQAHISNFMSVSMSPDLNTGTCSGIEALKQNWKLFTHVFPDGRLQLESLEKLTDECLIATTNTCKGRCDKEERKLGIIAKLKDQPIVMRGSVRFDWDKTSKRIIGLFSQTDMLTSMLDLLGNLEDVSHVFNGARVTPDGSFSV